MNGYLDTNGKLHKCDAYGHLDLAFDITDKMGIISITRLDAESTLLKLGWIVVRTNDVYGNIGTIKDASTDTRYHLTDSQKKWLNEHYSEMTNRCREAVDKMFEWDKK